MNSQSLSLLLLTKSWQTDTKLRLLLSTCNHACRECRILIYLWKLFFLHEFDTNPGFTTCCITLETCIMHKESKEGSLCRHGHTLVTFKENRYLFWRGRRSREEVGTMCCIHHNMDWDFSVLTETIILPCILIKCRYNAVVLSSDSE